MARVLATNEMNHAWMDEGSASYFGELGESHVFNIDFHPFYTKTYRDYISKFWARNAISNKCQ